MLEAENVSFVKISSTDLKILYYVSSVQEKKCDEEKGWGVDGTR